MILLNLLTCLSAFFFTDKNRGPVRNVTVPGNLLATTLENLHPAFRYNIIIRANNSIGLGLASHQVTAVLLEEGKKIYTWNLSDSLFVITAKLCIGNMTSKTT